MGKSRVHNNIRKLRFAHDEMTQQQLAEEVGVTRQTIIAMVQERIGLASLLLVGLVLAMAIAYYAWQRKAFAEDPSTDSASLDSPPAGEPPDES